MLAMQIASLVSEVGMRKLEEQMAVLKQLRDTWAGGEGSGGGESSGGRATHSILQNRL
jgi:hypothetical protein